MIPLQIAGLVIAGRALLTKYNRTATTRNNSTFNPFNLKYTTNGSNYKSRPVFKLRPAKRPVKSVNTPGSNPFQMIFKGLSSSISRITSSNKKENYSNILKEFIPEGSELLKPRYPANAGRIQLSDIDGDKNKELIASYKSANGIRTVILKKQDERWIKLSEINNPEYDSLNFRAFADIAGEGRKQLLLGVVSGKNAGQLYGYSLSRNRANEMFSRAYNNFEVIMPSNRNNNLASPHLAIWEKEDAGTYNIDLYKWNGLELERAEKYPNYYRNSVTPFFAEKLRQSPYSATNWYNFANALVKSNFIIDANSAIDVGISYDKTSALKDRFNSLKDSISK